MPRGQSSRRALVLVSALIGVWAGQALGAEPQPLEVGRPVDRDLAADEIHVYSINASSGQYMQAVIDQLGIDVAITLTGPDGKKLAEIDGPNGARQPEQIALKTEAAGLYRIEVRASNKGDAGAYRIELEQLHDVGERA